MRNALVLIPLAGLAAALVISTQSVASTKQGLKPQNTVGNMTTEASPGLVRAGATVQLSLTVSGPAEYTPCRPVSFWVEDASGRRVWSEVQFWMCPVEKSPASIPSGKSMTFRFDWPTRAMARGTYMVHGWFGTGQVTTAGNIPTITVAIE